jgi:hypothetical protein
MATRFYFPASGAAPVTPPTPAAAWTVTTGFAAFALKSSPSGTAKASGTARTKGSTTANTNRLDRQYLSEFQLAAQNITGTFSMVMRGLESAVGADDWLQVIIRVVSADGATVRGTLYAGSTATAESATVGNEAEEFGTTLATRIKNAIAVSAVTAQDGDRLLVEVGYRSNGTTSTQSGTLEYGDPASTADYALTSGLTTALVPWIEFSQTFTAYIDPSPQYLGKGTTVTIASAANLSLAHPANLVADDIEIAHIYLETPSVAITPPAGWAEIGTEASSGGTNTAIYRLFWKRAAGGETGSVTFTHGTVWRAGYITRWSNCITTGNPFETPGASAAAGTTGATTTSAVSDTTDGPNRTLLFVCANWSGASTWTPPSGFTEQYDSGGEIGGFSTKTQASAGATGSITATTNVSGPLVARLLILVPPDSEVLDLTKFFLSAA